MRKFYLGVEGFFDVGRAFSDIDTSDSGMKVMDLGFTLFLLKKAFHSMFQ
ncbi:MAG: hypothetical protein AAGF85_15030 [Bacteroidota bacterium]